MSSHLYRNPKDSTVFIVGVDPRLGNLHYTVMVNGVPEASNLHDENPSPQEVEEIRQGIANWGSLPKIVADNLQEELDNPRLRSRVIEYGPEVWEKEITNSR